MRKVRNRTERESLLAIGFALQGPLRSIGYKEGPVLEGCNKRSQGALQARKVPHHLCCKHVKELDHVWHAVAWKNVCSRKLYNKFICICTRLLSSHLLGSTRHTACTLRVTFGIDFKCKTYNSFRNCCHLA
jgi:hypothetical protein